MAYNPLLNPHPVSLTSTAITGSVAVTGTFWQATQPVSLASTTITGSVAVTGPLTDAQLRLTAVPVSLASTTVTGSVAVTGTFWQATQPVSGTFFQATQPVSIATMPTTPVTGTFWQATQPISLAAALPAGTNLIGRTGDATDLNRVVRNFIFDTPTAAPAAEALQSVTQWYNNAAVTTTTTPAVVPAGKTFRATGISMNTASLAAAGMVVLRIRANTAGLAAIGSPFTGLSVQAGSQAAVAALQNNQVIQFPEGVDFPAGTGLGFTLQGYVGATGTLQSFTRFIVYGYEYTT